MKIINVFLVSLSLFVIANKLVAQAADDGLQAADEISALQKQNTMLQKFLLDAQATIAAQQKRLEATEAVLSQKDLEQLSMAAAAEKLRADLEKSEAAISSLTLQLNDQRKRAEETLALLAAAQSVEKTMDDELTTALLALEAARLAQARSQDELDDLKRREADNNLKITNLGTELNLALAQVAAEYRQKIEELEEAEAISTEAQRKMALLSQEVRALRDQIGGLQATLDDYKRRDADNNVKITNLGRELKVALAQVAAEAKRNLGLEAAEKQRLQELQTTLDALDAAKITATSAVVFQSRLAESEAQLELVLNSSKDELKALKKDIDDLRSALSKAIAARQTAERQLTAAEQQAALLATAQAELQEAEAISTEAQRKMALLSQEVRALRDQIGGLQATLDDYKRRDADNNVKITNLGRELNVALAQVAAESMRNLGLEAAEKQRLQAEKARLEAEAKTLEPYKSDFFGSLRGLLEDIDGVNIVGDRFVFSSEVLFMSGRAELSAAGRREISKVADIFKAITQEIPQNIDWVLQVDGHTDDQPILPSSRFQNNWELSQARALSVVLYLTTTEQMKPSRLSANGFGQYQPINPANTRAARAQNRRIELFLTER